MTFGTPTVCGPVETNSCTVEPLATIVPAAGLVAMTLPAGTVLLF